jgi:hypothetical protein
MHSKFRYESLKEGSHLEILGVDRRIMLKWFLGKYSGMVWIPLI